MGYIRRGKWIRARIRDEMFVSGRGECVCEVVGEYKCSRLKHTVIGVVYYTRYRER